MRKNKLTWRENIYEIINNHKSKKGKLYNIVLLILILATVVLATLESIDLFNKEHHTILNILTWIVTILFSVDYFLRIISVKKPFQYIFSFYGVIDFLSTIPKYISLFFIDLQHISVLRTLRLLRVFRIFELSKYIGASDNLEKALKSSKPKIVVFLFFLVITCIILGTVMHAIEGRGNGFSNIPKSIYWAIVTLTTVGFGDITPQTSLGQFIASIIMILGYSVIAIPTGIVSSEIIKNKKNTNEKKCHKCLKKRHKHNAKYCDNCGSKLKIDVA